MLACWLACLLAVFFLSFLPACSLAGCSLLACWLVGWIACWLLCLLFLACLHALEPDLGEITPGSLPPKRQKMQMPLFTRRFDGPINSLFFNKATKIGLMVYHIIVSIQHIQQTRTHTHIHTRTHANPIGSSLRMTARTTKTPFVDKYSI